MWILLQGQLKIEHSLIRFQTSGLLNDNLFTIKGRFEKIPLIFVDSGSGCLVIEDFKFFCNAADG